MIAIRGHAGCLFSGEVSWSGLLWRVVAALTSDGSDWGGAALVDTAELTKQINAPQWLADRISGLPRYDPDSLDGVLVSVGAPLQHANTRTVCRTHFVRRDANDRPRVTELVSLLADRAIDYCIPRSRMNEAIAECQITGSGAPLMRLAAEARGLFTSLSTSGEGGELLLYTLLEGVLRIPQLMCKMPLKTNSQMHVHGTDGVHGKILPNGNLALYWGESKLHAQPSSAIDECFSSLAPFLIDDRDGAPRRDLYLLRDRVDPGDDEARAALVRYFIDGTLESGQVEIRAGCLVGFDLKDYPDPFDPEGRAVTKQVATRITRWQNRIRTNLDTHKLVSFEIEVFCVPVPSVAAFRAALRQKLELAS